VGDCRYCGKPAGWFRQQHKECDAKHHAGCEQILALAQDAIRNSGDLGTMEARAREVASSSYVQDGTVPALLVKAWENAVNAVLEDSVLSVAEETALERAQKHFGWRQDELDKNGTYTTVVKNGVLRDVLEGKVPTRFRFEGQLPFNFQKDERLLWAFGGVKYYEVRSRRSFVGGYQGVSVRVARGLYYRVGGFRGQPLVSAETVLADTGILGVTQKQLYFTGAAKSFRVRYDKIVSFTAYSDGIGFQRDAATAKPQSFQTGDGWFAYNLITNLANLQSGRAAPPRDSASIEVNSGADADLDDRFGLPIVGESNYQQALEAVCGGRNEDGVDLVVDASLTPEDSNPYDPQAVRVDIQGQKVGYLSRANARLFRKRQTEAGQASSVVACKARVKGGWDRGADDRGQFGVWLNVSL
jgi:hypothetical protein